MLENRWFQFLILSTAFYILEFIRPLEKRGRFFRKGLLQDIFCWIVLMDFYIYPLFEHYFDQSFQNGYRDVFRMSGTLSYFDYLSVNKLHWSVQFLIVFCVMELINYCVHRFMKHGPFWNFHKTHHSAKEMDQFSDARQHPAFILFEGFFLALPAMIILNPSVEVAGYFGMLTLVWGPLIHSNLRLKWPYPLSHVLSSPHTHRWHHAREKGVYCNYAGILALYDVMFGTFYAPENDCEEIGFQDDTEFPETPWGMLIYPFRKIYVKIISRK